MLIYLDRSAIDAVFEGDARERALKAVENLLRAHDDRKHLLSVDVSAKRLRSADLSRWARGALETLLSTRAETGDLRRRLALHMEAGVGDEFDGRLVSRGHQHVFRQSLLFFEDYERTVRSTVIAEDKTDALIYVELGRALLFAEHKQRRPPSIEPREGGGSSVADAYTLALESGRMTLAITDSDRDAPASRIGGTAQALRHAASHLDGWIADLGAPDQDRMPSAGGMRPPACAVVLHVRMLENLIPLSIYEEALPSTKTSSLLELHARAASPPWLDHAHLKTGLRLREIDHKASSAQAFWRLACQALGYPECKQSVECSTPEECRCEVIPGLESRAAERVLSWLQNARLEQVARLWGFRDSAPAPAPEKLRRLAEWVVSWGFAPAAGRAST